MGTTHIVFHVVGLFAVIVLLVVMWVRKTTSSNRFIIVNYGFFGFPFLSPLPCVHWDRLTVYLFCFPSASLALLSLTKHQCLFFVVGCQHLNRQLPFACTLIELNCSRVKSITVKSYIIHRSFSRQVRRDETCGWRDTISDNDVLRYYHQCPIILFHHFIPSLLDVVVSHTELKPLWIILFDKEECCMMWSGVKIQLKSNQVMPSFLPLPLSASHHNTA